MKAIEFSTGSKSFFMDSSTETYVKRTEYDMNQRPESECLYVEKVRYVGKNKNLYLVHVDDVAIGESIYDVKGNYEAYRIG